MMKPSHLLVQYHLYKSSTQGQPVFYEHKGNYVAFTVAELHSSISLTQNYNAYISMFLINS